MSTNKPSWNTLALLSVAQFMVVLDITVVNVALPSIGSDLGFARGVEVLASRGRSAFDLLAGGVAVSSACLAAVTFAPTALALPLWFAFVAAGSSVVLGYSLVSERYPPAMAGRVNTGINVFGFVGMFSGQWLFGVILDFWPQTPSGYAREAYPWALGLLWSVQLAGLIWLVWPVACSGAM